MLIILLLIQHMIMTTCNSSNRKAPKNQGLEYVLRIGVYVHVYIYIYIHILYMHTLCMHISLSLYIYI